MILQMVPDHQPSKCMRTSDCLKSPAVPLLDAAPFEPLVLASSSYRVQQTYQFSRRHPQLVLTGRIRTIRT